MFCTKCGAEVSEDQNFCNKCGNKLIKEDSKITEDQTATASSAIQESQREEPLVDRVEIEIVDSVEASTVNEAEVNEEADFESEDIQNEEIQIIEDTNAEDVALEDQPNDEEKPSEYYCKKCGNELNENANFCTKCGENLQDKGKIVNQKPSLTKEVKAKKAKKSEEKTKNGDKKKSKGIVRKLLVSLLIVLIIVVGLAGSAILYTHYSEFEMAYENIDYEKYIEENIEEMVEEKSDDTYEIAIHSDLLNSALNSNLSIISTGNSDISINKAFFDIENQRLYFSIAYKNFDLNLSSHVALKLNEQSVEINLDDIKAGRLNIPVPGFITNLLPKDMLKISYDIEQIPDFIIANDIKYDKDSLIVNYEVDYEFLAKDLQKYKSADSLDENIVKIYQYSQDTYKQTLGQILDPDNNLTEDNVKTLIELYEEDKYVFEDVFVALDKATVDSIAKDYDNYISISVDSNTLEGAKKEIIKENFFEWISEGTAPGVDVVVGDSLDVMYNIYGYDNYNGEWNDYKFYYYEYLSDTNIEDTGGVVFLTPYSYYSDDYYNITVIELYEPYDFMGIDLSMTIPEITDILGTPMEQYYDHVTGYYKTIFRSGNYLASFYSYNLDSESYYFDISEY